VSIRVVEPLSRCGEAAVYYEEWVKHGMRAMAEAQEKAQEQLRGMFGSGAVIDEMAIMFQNPYELRSWVDAAVRLPGVVLFNTAHDSVSTQPIPSRYNVHYWFLSSPWPEGYEPGEDLWRVEAMYAHKGSPMHDALRDQFSPGESLTVHASFKCADEEAYGVATNTLQRNGYEAVQRCESTYGRFSYWRQGEQETGVFLKPRVNLRDTEDNDA